MGTGGAAKCVNIAFTTSFQILPTVPKRTGTLRNAHEIPLNIGLARFGTLQTYRLAEGRGRRRSWLGCRGSRWDGVGRLGTAFGTANRAENPIFMRLGTAGLRGLRTFCEKFPSLPDDTGVYANVADVAPCCGARERRKTQCSCELLRLLRLLGLKTRRGKNT